MRVFLLASLLSLSTADQSHHQVIKQGNAPAVSHSVHKAHGAHAATVVSQPHAAPQSVHAYHNSEKNSAAAIHHAPGYHAAVPAYHAPVVHARTYHAAAPVYHAPIIHAPAPAYHAPVIHAPAYHAPVVHTPVYHAPAPAYHAPVVHAPTYHAPAPAYHTPVVAAPTYHTPVVHAPAYHAPTPAYKPTAYHEPESYGPAPYTFEYAVADDYSNAAFNAAETSDANGAVSGGYSVALPDGRTQHVSYTANGYDGYIAEVTYSGQATYPGTPEYHAPTLAYHA